MIKRDAMRSLKFYDPNRKDSVLVVGAGSTGSYVAFALAQLGVNKITLIDHDIVEAHNLPNQFISDNVVGDTNYKVLAVMKSIKLIIPDADILAVPSKIEQFLDSSMCDSYTAVFSCVDRMDVRKFIYDNFKTRTGLIIDPRAGGEYANVYCWDSRVGDAYDFYSESLKDTDADIPDLPCNGTCVIDGVMALAAECVQRFRKWCQGIVPIAHSFHDYHVGGSSSIMETYSVGLPDQKDDVIRSERFVNNVGREGVAEK